MKLPASQLEALMGLFKTLRMKLLGKVKVMCIPLLVIS